MILFKRGGEIDKLKDSQYIGSQKEEKKKKEVC